MTVLLFLAVLFVLVLVHEWGHFIVAKKTGMRVDEFGIGFPPKLLSVRWGETLYTLNLVPIGGFVRIYGENAEDAAADAAEGRDVEGSFASKSKWAQAAVLIAGVTMNVLFAWFLFVAILMIGSPTEVDPATATDAAELRVTAVVEESPAADAGLEIGDEILSLSAGDDVLLEPNHQTLSEFIQAHGDEEIAITFQEGAADIAQVATLVPEQGVIAESPDTYAVGLGSVLVETQKASLFEAVVEGAKMTWQYTVLITVGLFTFFGQIFTGQADFAQVAGPVGIAGMVGDAAAFGFTSLLLFTATISLNLAVINLLPIPALDGGRLIFVGIEAVTKKRVPPVWFARINAVGFLFLIGLMIAVTVSDVVKL